MSVIDDYLKKVPKEQHKTLQHVRDVIAETGDFEEVISYGMPGFRYKGKYLITFGSFKDHMSVFPGADPIIELHDELKPFVTSKGTIQFTVEQPLPDKLLRALVKRSMEVIDEK